MHFPGGGRKGSRIRIFRRGGCLLRGSPARRRRQGVRDAIRNHRRRRRRGVKRFTCPLHVRASRPPITEFRDIREAKPRQRRRRFEPAITSGSAVSLLTRLCAPPAPGFNLSSSSYPWAREDLPLSFSLRPLNSLSSSFSGFLYIVAHAVLLTITNPRRIYLLPSVLYRNSYTPVDVHAYTYIA